MLRVSMRKLVAVVAIAISGCAVVLGQRDVKANHRAADEKAIRGKVKEMETGWNRKSGSLFAKPFAVNSDYVVVNGMHLSGHDEIERGHQLIFDTVLKDSSLLLLVKQIRFLRPDVALVHVSGQLNDKASAELRDGGVIISLVMTKEKGQWEIVAFQNTAVDQRR